MICRDLGPALGRTAGINPTVDAGYPLTIECRPACPTVIMQRVGVLDHRDPLLTHRNRPALLSQRSVARGGRATRGHRRVRDCAVRLDSDPVDLRFFPVNALPPGADDGVMSAQAYALARAVRCARPAE